MLKENQFTLENGDICEVAGSVVTNISDMERRQAAENEKQQAEEASI